MHMPVMNGMQVAFEIRRISHRTKITIPHGGGAKEAAVGARLLGISKSEAGKELIPAVKRLLLVNSWSSGDNAVHYRDFGNKVLLNGNPRSTDSLTNRTVAATGL